jgi:hypothetical protein
VVSGERREGEEVALQSQEVFVVDDYFEDSLERRRTESNKQIPAATFDTAALIRAARHVVAL